MAPRQARETCKPELPRVLYSNVTAPGHLAWRCAAADCTAHLFPSEKTPDGRRLCGGGNWSSRARDEAAVNIEDRYPRPAGVQPGDVPFKAQDDKDVMELVLPSPRSDEIGPGGALSADDVVLERRVREAVGLDCLGERADGVRCAADRRLRVCNAESDGWHGGSLCSRRLPGQSTTIHL